MSSQSLVLPEVTPFLGPGAPSDSIWKYFRDALEPWRDRETASGSTEDCPAASMLCGTKTENAFLNTFVYFLKLTFCLLV